MTMHVQLHLNFSKNVRTLPKGHMHIFNVSVTTVQSLKNVNLKVWEELITQSVCHLFKTCWKNNYVQLHVNLSKNVTTLPKIHMHIFNVSITTMEGLKIVSLKVLEELITQCVCHLFKTCRKNNYFPLHVNFSKNVRTLPKSHMQIFNVSISSVQGLKSVS
jgi:CDP-diacylglycerol pyrophosphatase